jgi:hypothetical protein
VPAIRLPTPCTLETHSKPLLDIRAASPAKNELADASADRGADGGAAEGDELDAAAR